MATATQPMSREEAVERARAHWDPNGDREWYWRLDGQSARYTTEALPVYGLPEGEGYWYVPLEDVRPHVGASTAVLVFPESGQVRTVRYGE